MFRALFVFLFSCINCYCIADTDRFALGTKMNSLYKTATINLLDTVVFDLAKSDTLPTSISFPVYILSDDTINALDFSFKYNELDFLYDSISDLTTYMQTFSYYNPMDSTLRFTSNSFQRYENDSALVSIHFTVLSGQFCKEDINKVKVYLNGDGCSVKIEDCLHLAVPKIQKSKNEIKIYPNPASVEINVQPSQNALLELFATDGSRMLQTNVKANREEKINTAQIANGIYFLRATNAHFSITTKISIQK